ncbi:MAG: glycerol-3-phosphate acyltransferase [Lachnospiraceae bacterium]|nr:glycerol-3-phosphate acyltransferase [Lachnospiraceae bacterium]
MEIILCGLFGYLVGNINPSYIIGRLKGFDIRNNGSGNAGASNAVLLMGKKIGAFSALFDIFKAYFAVSYAFYLFPECEIIREVTAVGCILGHIFPILMRFKGGKGLACIGGSIMAYNVKLFIILLFVEILLALITDYICLIPVTVSIIVPVLYAVYKQSLLALLLLSVTALVVLCKHIPNLKRIAAGREVRISYLWNRDEELERLKEAWNQDIPEIK